MRRNKNSELNSTVVAISVIIVVMTSPPLFRATTHAYNNFHTKETNESRNSE